MIISLRLKNFYSLRDYSALDFTADLSSRKSAEHLPENFIEFSGNKFVNIIGLFGSNASGKSNIIKAVDFCRNLVLKSHLNNEGDVFDFEPFKFGEKQASEFYIDFVTEGVEYEYSFSIEDNKIISEELFYYPAKRKSKVFSRQNGTEYSFGKGLLSRPKEIAANTGEKNLFLSRASSMNRPIAQNVYRFFLNEMNVSSEYFDLSKITREELDSNKELLLKAFEVSDSDIIDIQFTESSTGKVKLLTFHKENPSIAFDFESEESEGTKRLLFLLLLIFKTATNKACVFIDEFDLKLHLRLSELILDAVRASNGAQIVFTSHNPSLIDREKLRREQIVFVTKYSDGNSEFAPLSDYDDVGKNADIQKAYMLGAFDAVPYVGDIYPVLKEIIERNETSKI